MHQKYQKCTVCGAHINISITFFHLLFNFGCLSCLWLCKFPQSLLIRHSIGGVFPVLSPFFNLILSFNKSPLCPQWEHSMCLKLLCTTQSWPLCCHTAFFIPAELCVACRKPCSFWLHGWGKNLGRSTKFSRWAMSGLLHSGHLVYLSLQVRAATFLCLCKSVWLDEYMD